MSQNSVLVPIVSFLFAKMSLSIKEQLTKMAHKVDAYETDNIKSKLSGLFFRDPFHRQELHCKRKNYYRVTIKKKEELNL